MVMEIVDLYQYFDAKAPENAVGRLTCYTTATPQKVSPCRKKPAVLILPGGAYRWTSPREAEPVALRFLAKGWAAFVLDYSVAPCGFPTSLREACYAMRFIRENAGKWEIDPNMVAATGFSAGGHLCGCLGTLYDCPEVADIGDASLLRPDALGLCYPVAVSWGRTHGESFQNISRGDEALKRRLSLDQCVRPDMPPVFLWHTRDDGSVPCRNSLVLATALEEAGVDFAMHIFRHGKHGLSTADQMSNSTREAPDVSWDVPGWVEAEMRFFGDIGLKIRDFEVNL